MTNESFIILLAPQLYGAPGGVQAYMRRLREIMTMYSKIKGFNFHCISLVDGYERRQLHLHSVQHGTYEGCEGQKLVFVLNAIRRGLGRGKKLIIVGHMGQAPVARILKELGLGSYILVLHGIEAWKRAAWIDRWATRGAECIVATTHYTAQEFCRHNGIRPERMKIIPLALAEEWIALPNTCQERNLGLNVLTVGRLSIGDRHKGIHLLIKAVRKARNESFNVRLTVVGDGEDLSQLKELVSNLGLVDDVRFVGQASDEKLQQLYQECDVFAMPSKKEGFGIVFIEAMRYGKPCIGGNHGGTPEVITQGVDGYLLNYGDVDQLARFLIEFARRPELKQEMGLKGYEKVKTSYLFPHMRDKWFALLDEFTGK